MTHAATAIPGSVRVRPRHVLSALAAGAAAGFWACGAVTLALMVVIGLAGSSIPPDFDSWAGVLGSAVGATLGGLLYVNVLAWLPRPLLRRSVAFGLLGAPVVAGVHATAYGPGMPGPEAPIAWILAIAIGTALATPVTLRAVLYLTVRSTASVAALPVITSLILLGSVLVVPLRDGATVASIVAVAPLGLLVLVILIVALGIVSWMFGVGPPELRPTWFLAFGSFLSGLAALTGIAMIAGTMAAPA